MNIFNESIDIIKNAAKNAGNFPGIYKMMNENDKVIYVGKAKDLEKRLMSYTRIDQLSNRIRMMISKIKKIETTRTNSEIEALLLENNLIKEIKPFFNILLKDDKTFPYIVIDEKSEYPRIYKYRTNKSRDKNFFGPYPFVNSLDETIKIIQKTFLLRTCSDNNFKNRSRPCLNYFLKRCSAPCVNYISSEEYKKNVELSKDLLKGNDEIVRKSLVESMRYASENLDFEKAAIFRDRIKAITDIQSTQYIQIDDTSSIDIIGISKGNENSVIQILFFRCGKNVGSENFIIQNSSESDTSSNILESFILQFYNNVMIPSKIIVSNDLENKENIENILHTKIIRPKSGIYIKLLENALENAHAKLNRENIKEYQNEVKILENLLCIENINRIETYDNSHIMGTNACGVMIVFENGHLKRSEYRKFNIDKITANKGDDISMMKFVLYKRLTSKNIDILPDLIIMDGGITQLHAALEIVENLKLGDKMKIISVCKQNNRKIGDEKIIMSDGNEMEIERNSELLSFLIMLRNEAHKTAITFHRKKRQKSLSKSILDDIPSIGSVRKKRLLEYFGSVESIKRACIEDICLVEGIDKNTAKIVFDFFNKGNK